jgi:glycosyltransferase involved in cell wall biosynthesis
MRAISAGCVDAGSLVLRFARLVKILLWHGYLLGGTGSNVYTRALAREWVRAGHEVTVFSQEPQPERYELGGAAVVRPDVGGLLPVFVLDRYEGYEVKLVQDCERAELHAWVERNAAAVREHLPADVVFANHVLLGGPVAAATGARYAVKAHGSELEYSMRGNEALSAWGRETLERAQAVFVGSAHIRHVLEDVVGHVDRVHEVPPGVDVDDWRPRPRDEALAGLIEEARRDPPNPGNASERLPDEGNAERLAAFLAGDEPTVVYFGKLLYNKGVHVLLEALRDVDARAVVVGFGDYRGELEALAGPRVLFTGPFEHRHLVHLLALADATVVPSIFPEAFGMVAAEAAAAGSPPLVARHSGLAEVAEGLEASYPPHLRHLASFTTGDAGDLAAKLRELLSLPSADRTAVREAAREATVSRWSWAGVARRLLEPFDYPQPHG